MKTIGLTQLRRFVVAHQGFATRFRRAHAVDVEAIVRRLSAIQLDSISVVERSHRIVLTSRIGAYPKETESMLLQTGRLFEYWAHEACLLPIEDWPLFKWKMARMRESGIWKRGTIGERPELAQHVLESIRERGPLGSRHFGGKGGGGMWSWKPEKEMLETLFAAGELVAAGRQGFQRLYDLPERVIPRELLEAPEPTEDEYRRGYILRAVRGRGVLTEKGISEHCRFPRGVALVRPHVDALADRGLVRRVAVEDGGSPVVVATETPLEGDVPRGGGVLLSPFDNMLWDRVFVERVFGFRHVIEVYKRGHERLYGYYVLPFLYGDRMVGRADLKSDRTTGTLTVRAFHLEPNVRASRALDGALEKALWRLARYIGLEHVRR
jgi:uncharacterized protein